MLKQAIIDWIYSEDENLLPDPSWTLNDFMQLKSNNGHKIGDALYIAAQVGHTKKFLYILNKFTLEKVELSALKESLTRRDAEGKNILHMAAQWEISNTQQNKQKDNSIIIGSLVRMAKVVNIPNYINQPDEVFGATAVHFAVRSSAINNLHVLIQNGANSYVKTVPKKLPKKKVAGYMSGQTPFEYALMNTYRNHQPMVECLFNVAVEKKDSKQIKIYKNWLMECLHQKRASILTRNLKKSERETALEEYKKLHAAYLPLLRHHRSTGLVLWYHTNVQYVWAKSAREEEMAYENFMKKVEILNEKGFILEEGKDQGTAAKYMNKLRRALVGA